jgi:hypothetical protein
MLNKIIAAAAAKANYEEQLENLPKTSQKNIVMFDKVKLLQNLLATGFVAFENSNVEPDYRRLRNDNIMVFFMASDTIQVASEKGRLNFSYTNSDENILLAIKLLA